MMKNNATDPRMVCRSLVTAGLSRYRFGKTQRRVWYGTGLVFAVAVAVGCTSTTHYEHPGGRMSPHHEEHAPEPGPVSETLALNLDAVSDIEGIMPELADKRVVIIGEIHDRFDHHQTQLEIIRRLHAMHPRLAIGMEAFQQPFQHFLDDYVEGRLSDRQMLRSTEYYRRWKYDFRLYAPILRYAKENQIPVVALNLPEELTGKVGHTGVESLTEEERLELPGEIDRSDSDYEARLKEIYEQHPHETQRGFDNFLEVQLLWDEGMAERAADYLKEHPEHMMVVLAGGGHIAYGSGIPHRLERRLPVSMATILNGWQGPLKRGLADFLLLPDKQSLPTAGKIGALLDSEDGKLTVNECLPDSPCQTAGMRPGDQVVSIDGEPIADMADLRYSTWDKTPGDKLSLVIRRKSWLSQPKELDFEIELQ